MNPKEEIKELEERLRKYQDTYYKEGKSLVSDSEYDRLFDRLRSLESEYPELSSPDSPTLRVGSDLTSDFPEVRHSIPVLSLDKAYSSQEVLSFIDKSIKKEGEELSFVAEEKIDGISMVLYYQDGILERAVTRGNGEIGNDVTPNIKTIFSVPLRLKESVTLAVRGEVYLPKADFERINAELDEEMRAANPRNLAAGSVRRQRSSETARVPLDIFSYEGFWQDKSKTPKDHLSILSKLKELGFRIDPNLAFFDKTKEEAERRLEEAGLKGLSGSFSDLQKYIDGESRIRAKLPYEIDGLVFKINELDVRERFGYTGHHPRWAIAYKFEPPEAEATLLDITCQVGRTGRITPVAEITPTKIGGSTVKRATLHNQDYINSLELALGDRVAIVKRGDVIPAVERVIDKNEEGNTTFILPKKCPCCGSDLISQGAHEFCPNKECPDQRIGKIVFFASRSQMDIEGFGPQTAKDLYDSKILMDLKNLYRADYSRLFGLNGYGASLKGDSKGKVDKLLKSLEESKNRPFRTVLSSLGIPEVGKRVVDSLVENGIDSFDRLIEISREKNRDILTSIGGIGDKLADTIISAFSDERILEIIESFREAGLHMSQDMDEGDDRDYGDDFKGQTWVVTGSFENFNPREKALEEVRKRGGNTSSSISKSTTHLLVGKGGGSKREKAEALGVRLVTEEEFLDMIGAELIKKDGELF